MTRPSVRWVERIMRVGITTAGLGTIAAVALICVFLVAVAAPLFGRPEVSPASPPALALPAAPAPLVRVLLDDARSLVAVVRADGNVRLLETAGGSTLREERPFAEPPTAWSFVPGSDVVLAGFADGAVRPLVLGFSSRFPPEEDLPEALRTLAPGQRRVHEQAVGVRPPSGPVRVQELRLEAGEPLGDGIGQPVRALAHTTTPLGLQVLAAGEGGRVVLFRVRERRNLMTRKTTYEVRRHDLPPDPGAGGPVAHVALSGVGDTGYVIEEDGRCVRYDLRDPTRAEVGEVLDLVEEPGRRVSALAPLLGQTTLMVGDDGGRLRAWFSVRPEGGTDTSDGLRLVPAHLIEEGAAPVTALGVSPRTRQVVAGHADGTVRLFQVTNQTLVAEVRADAPIEAVALAPKEDGFVALTGEGIRLWDMGTSHAEASPAGLFLAVWYEGHARPEHVWQSTGGSDAFEPKYGFVPLIFGTLKAAFYSLLFGVPLALLAALFTSEFLTRGLRSPVKSVIELMAGLPSVVLGFLAALVIAPFVEGRVAAVLTAFLAIPLAFLLGAQLWQILPLRAFRVLGGWPRLLGLLLVVPVAVMAAGATGPWVEERLFAGDVRQWLAGRRGGAFGGWVVLLLPLSAAAVAVLMGAWVRPWIRRMTVAWERGPASVADLARFLAGLALTLLLAVAGAHGLDLLGIDPRGEVHPETGTAAATTVALVGTYVQRNALIVGFVMGFAIIPIVYTLAEDALSSVPGDLREGSLGAGATRWQTAVRIVVPTAMSGLFSAVMIGMGRAVGETMIVLMATGNTAILDVNPFNGLRALSANLATELPEAPLGSTHYRTLFLTAVVLFLMTFVVNTAAEAVRQRFRRRAFQL